jgi:hypothetical protein
MIRLGIAFVLCLSFFACKRRSTPESDLFNNARPVGSYKGVAAVENIIRQRIWKEDYFRLGSYLGDSGDDGISLLLGSYDGATGLARLHNPTPNPVNTMLWAILMDKFAAEVVHLLCQGGVDPRIEYHFGQAAIYFCDNTDITEDDSKRLQALWLRVMRYDAPQSEMQAWISEVQSNRGVFASKLEHRKIKTLLQSLLMHPYFLLSH